MTEISEDRVREIKHLLDSAIINIPEAKRMLGITEESMTAKIDPRQINWPESKPVAPQIKSDQAYHTANDDKGRCPYSYCNADQRFLGTMTVDGVPRPTYHCTGCNKAYAELPAAVKALMDEAQRAGHTMVGFTPAAPGPGVTSSDANSHMIASHTQQTYQKLDQVNNNLSSLNYTIQSLMDQVRVLASQNNLLMEKLATDPMVSVRKQVAEFNLK